MLQLEPEHARLDWDHSAAKEDNEVCFQHGCLQRAVWNRTCEGHAKHSDQRAPRIRQIKLLADIENATSPLISELEDVNNGPAQRIN